MGSNIRKSAVLTALHQSVIEGKIPAKTVADSIGKTYSTLMREMNPYDTGAKIGVETFMDIVKITGDATPLQAMAQELGFCLTPLEEKNHA